MDEARAALQSAAGGDRGLPRRGDRHDGVQPYELLAEQHQDMEVQRYLQVRQPVDCLTIQFGRNCVCGCVVVVVVVVWLCMCVYPGRGERGAPRGLLAFASHSITVAALQCLCLSQRNVLTNCNRVKR